MLTELGRLFLISLAEVAYLLGTIIVIGFVLGFLSKKSNGFLFRSVGRKGPYLTAIIGTPIHELGHAVMCLLFGHTIDSIKLLQFNDPNGTMGYVNHSWNPHNLYQRMGNFFIGVAPIFSGILAILFSMFFLVPDSFDVLMSYLEKQAGNTDASIFKDSFIVSMDLVQNLFSYGNLTSLWFWLFLFIGISVASHIDLSPSDIKGASSGLVTILIVVFLLNLTSVGTTWKESINLVLIYNSFIFSFSIIAILFALINLVVSMIVFQVYHGLKKKKTLS